MLWSVEGAEAILKPRGVFRDELWDEFWAFRPKREKKRGYGIYENVHHGNQGQSSVRKAA